MLTSNASTSSAGNPYVRPRGRHFRRVRVAGFGRRQVPGWWGVGRLSQVGDESPRDRVDPDGGSESKALLRSAASWSPFVSQDRTRPPSAGTEVLVQGRVAAADSENSAVLFDDRDGGGMDQDRS